MTSNKKWPVLREYDQEHLPQIAMPMGGIGTGTISMGGRGNLCDWELTNKPRKGFTPRYTFFLLRCQKENESPAMRIMEAEIPPPFQHYRGFDDANYSPHGLPRFQYGSFRAAYPLGQTVLSSPEIPLQVCIQGFNPMVPGDEDISGMPFAMLRFVLTNPGESSISASILGSLMNFIGDEYRRGTQNQVSGNINRYIEADCGNHDLSGLFMEAPGVLRSHSSYGTLAVAFMDEKGKVHHNCDWLGKGRAVCLERLWHRFESKADLNVSELGSEMPVGALSTTVDVPPGSSRSITMLIGWHFPNRAGWESDTEKVSENCSSSGQTRNWYTTQYRDAWDVLNHAASTLHETEQKTVQFVTDFIQSNVPEVIKEAALFNACTLRSTTCFRLENGYFFGFEGSNPGGGCCPGSCTHVWGYETAMPYLYGNLSRSMRDVHFLYATDEKGLMSFRVSLPLDEGAQQKKAAADGQMSALIKLYRDWKLNGDTNWLKKLWPKAKAAMAFAWCKNGWDGDADGVMEGVQHNTTDFELFGPNPIMACWYLAALKACEHMAAEVGDNTFAQTCQLLFLKGKQWVDDNLFNGEYYVQSPRIPPSLEEIPEGLCLELRNKVSEVTNVADLPQQVHNGCQTDQLAGQLLAHVCGLGYILDPENIQTTLRAIYRRNFKVMRQQPAFFRAFAMNDEHGLFLGTYPEEDMPKDPFCRFYEVLSGLEYTAAAHMIYEGQTENALDIVNAIRNRHDGRKRNPFNEPECGNHYARALASWSCYWAWTGFDYNALTGAIRFNPARDSMTFFWSNGYAWGIISQKREGNAINATITVRAGELNVQTVNVIGFGIFTLEQSEFLQADESMTCEISAAADSRRPS